jgi:ElaB/YqjD/DUF883 family membrane-anchored ribosome-binding protein
MTNETNWPSDEQTRKAAEDVQKTGEDALRTGQKYLRENPILIILLTLIVGAVLGALMRPTPRKDPDPVQAVRDWFDKTLQEFIAKLPAAKKQMRSIQEDVMDRTEDLRKKFRFPCR